MDAYCPRAVRCAPNLLPVLGTLAYSAFTHGVMSKWNFILRTIPDIQTNLLPLEDTIQKCFLPSITGQNPFGQQLRSLMALPARAGGIGLKSPASESTAQYKTSRKITRLLVELVLQQSQSLPPETYLKQSEQKSQVRASNRQAEEAAISNVVPNLPSTLKKVVEISREKGASSWLTVLPIEEHGFSLHKRDFRDALCLRYGWPPPMTPSHCVCNQRFTIEHTLSCPHGGLPSIRHNEIRNITAHLMSEVCHNVGIEPTLQPLSGETMNHRTSNITDGARLDVKAQGFWGCERQCAFFDVRVFNPFAHSYHNVTLANCYKRNEQEKRRAYDQRVREIEHGCFSPLVFSVAGRYGALCSNDIQETGDHDIDEVPPTTVQPNYQLAEMQTKLLTPLLCHHVHPWIALLSRSPCTPNPE